VKRDDDARSARRVIDARRNAAASSGDCDIEHLIDRRSRRSRGGARGDFRPRLFGRQISKASLGRGLRSERTQQRMNIRCRSSGRWRYSHYHSIAYWRPWTH